MHGSLLEKARTGLLWAGGFQVLHQVLQFGLTIALARLLSPADFGTFAVVVGIIGFLNAFSCQSFLSHLVQARDKEEVPLQSHFTFAFLLQTILYVITNVVAFALQWTTAYADIAHYIYVMAPVVLLGSVAAFRAKMLERELNWKRLRLLQSVGLVATLLTTICLAISGLGLYALLLSQNVKHLPHFYDLFVNARFRPTWHFAWSNFRPAFWFGVNRLGSEGISKGRVMLESNALLNLTSLSAIGFFNRSVSLSHLAAAQFTAIVTSGVYPVLTRVDPDSDRFKRGANGMLLGIAWSVIPLAILTSVTAEDLVPFLYGPQWLESIPMVPAAMVLGAVGTLSQASYLIVLAAKEQRLCLYGDVARLLGLVTTIATWSLYQSLIVFLVLQAIVELCVFVFFACHASNRNLISLVGHFKDIAIALSTALVSAALCVQFLYLADEQVVLNRSIRLVSACLVFGASYTVLLRMLFSTRLSELVYLLPRHQMFARLLRLPVAGGARS